MAFGFGDYRHGGEMVHLLSGNGRFDFEVVGESHYQHVLRALAGPKCVGGHDVDCLAALLCQDDNPFDAKAVAVAVVLRDTTVLPVAYLARAMARAYRKSLASNGRPGDNQMLCRAKIVGGWSDSGDGEGSYGVKLDFVLPIEFKTAKAWETWESRLL